MRHLSLAVITAASTIAFAQIASARPLAPAYSWTGWYVGGNIGYSWGDANTDLTGNGGVSNLVACSGGGALCLFTNSLAFADSNTARLDGVLGGGQVGYNYQFSPNGVVGIEADIQGADQRGSG